MYKYLKPLMLKAPFRNFVINSIKAPLRKAIEKAGDLIPKPTKENLAHPNSLKLLAIRDRFLEYEGDSNRRKLFEAGFNILIAEYEHDSYYRDRIDWLLEIIREIKWKPRMINHPARCSWGEHRPENRYRKREPIA